MTNPNVLIQMLLINWYGWNSMDHEQIKATSSSSYKYIQTNYYQYSDTKCTGETVAFEFDVNGFCQNGASISCLEDDSIFLQMFSNKDCTGNVIYNTTNPPSCVTIGYNQIIQKCVNSIEIPSSDSFISVISSSCDWKDSFLSIGVMKTDVCLYSGQNSSQNRYCNQTTFIQEYYDNSNSCAGTPRIVTTPLPGCQDYYNNTVSYICN